MAVSIKDIAREAGVTDATVSMALHDHPRISASRRQQIKELSRRMGYRPNVSARTMRTRKSHSIGLLIGNLRTGISNRKAEAIEACMVAAGYQVLVGFTQSESRRTIEYVRGMAARQVDGLVLVGGSGDGNWPSLQKALRGAQTPCVLVDFSFDTGFPGVGVDRVAGMRKVGEHLVRMGHRDIAYVHVGPHPQKTKKEGLALGVGSGPEHRLRLVPVAPPPPFSDPRAAEELVALKAAELAAWPDRPSAVVLSSDTLAMAFITGLRRAGLRVPQDMSVTGFDDADEARFFEPALTTVRQPHAELGRKAAEMLLGLMRREENGNQDTKPFLLAPELVVRESTGPAAKEKQRRKAGG